MVHATGEILQGRYRIVSFLSKGGMGVVYQAQHLHLDVPVAIKEMLPQPDLDPNTLAQLRQQFQREAAVLARLNHPHLVNVTDFFEEGGSTYLVMRFVEGESLAQRIERQGALPEQEVLIWADQLLDALAYCHAQGAIHRDVKPHNVIICDGRAVLVDFGLVKLWNPRDPRTRTAMRGMGTPQYAPPEQYDAQAGSGYTDVRADVYGLGATLYHALTGRIPPTATERIVNPTVLLPVRKLNSKVSARTEAVVDQALKLQPSARFQSAVEMRAALAGTATDTTGTQVLPARSAAATQVKRRTAIPARVWGLLGAAAAVAVLALLMGIALALGSGSDRAIHTPRVEETVTTIPTAVTEVVEKTAAPSPSSLLAATSRPTRTPLQRPTPTQMATVTPRPQSVTSTPLPPTSTPIPSTPTQVPVAPPTLAPRATAPELVAPAQGGTYRSPVTFQWGGSLGAGQAYQVTTHHAESGYVIQSGLLTDQSWTADLPADKYGEWRWAVTVVQNGNTLATSSEWMFWFNPRGGDGGGGGGGGGGGTEEASPAPP